MRMDYQRKKLLGQMVDLEVVLGDKILAEEETVEKASLFMDYEEPIKHEETSWDKNQGLCS